jgi:superoxide dismutase, Fe-Mn family
MNATMNPVMELALSANFDSVDGWRVDALSHLHRDPANVACVELIFHRDTGRLSHQGVPKIAVAAASNAPDVVTLLTLNTDPRISIEDIDWSAVYALYQTAVHDASEAFAANQSELGAAFLVDVRRAGMFEKAQTMIPNAQWRDPALVGQWAQSVPRDQPVVVYCIYGHEVGRSTAMRLRAAGVQARYLAGGIDAWQTAGLPLVNKPSV